MSESEENRQQQNSGAANPEEKMFRQLRGIDFLLVHDGRILFLQAIRRSG
jgi:hypothetical protein